MHSPIAKFHLPGLFEFYDFYRIFLPLYKNHKDWFYEWVKIASIYGAPADCLWGGGRVGFGDANAKDVLNLIQNYDISPRFTFSNSLLEKKHLKDKKCNQLCKMFQYQKKGGCKTGVIIHSPLLLSYIKETYPSFYFVSSTTKVITNFEDFKSELNQDDFSYVVPDFRLNKSFDKLNSLNQKEKDKVEFLCNECCWIKCQDRKTCYENVSRKSLGLDVDEHICRAPESKDGYKFSRAMENPSFISLENIQGVYLPTGFTNFKIEGRSLGSALLLELLLYYLVKPDYHLKIREEIYLDSSLDLF